MAFSSGLGATTTLMLMMKSGDHIVVMDDVYGGKKLYTLAAITCVYVCRIVLQNYSHVSYLHHGLLSPSVADCALTRDYSFQRLRSLLETFNSARPSFDQAKMLLRHHFCRLSLLLFPSTTMPSKQSFEKPTSNRLMCQNNLKTLFLIVIGVRLVVFSRSLIFT